ncbi:hypothetical protein C8D79_1354 [Bacteriovorax stolpii]|nr:hypothetical protein C8D79_1354 [Bacteriovorax stolpii]
MLKMYHFGEGYDKAKGIGMIEKYTLFLRG